MARSIAYGTSIIVVTALLVITVQDASGHGIGYELLPPVWLGKNQVSLEVSSSRYEDIDNPEREIRFALMNAENRATVRDVTYGISAYKGEVHLFDRQAVTTKDGILIFSFEYEDADVHLEDKNPSGLLSLIFGNNEKTIRVLGRHFDSGGLYKFDVEILSADSISNPSISYNVGISIPERAEWYVNDPNFGTKRIDTITYYDKIADFAYEPSSRTVSFSMPFEWSAKNINETSIIHEEISFDKSFGDLLVDKYTVEVNGRIMPEKTATIDDFSGKERIVHIIISQSSLYEFEKSSYNDVMNFVIRPSDDAVLSTVAENGQFRIDLWWEPKDLVGGQAVFYFKIKDVFLMDKAVAAEYRLSVVHDGVEIFAQEGTSTDNGNASTARVKIPDGVSGYGTVQFEDLGGIKLARAEFPVIFERISDDSVPQWVKRTAGWWAEGTVSDEEFVAAMGHLVRDGIIQVRDSETAKGDAVSVPQWVKRTAGWWAEGTVSDEEFVASIGYLISVRILAVG